MMAAMYWIKLYHEILDDYKMFTLSDRLYRRTIEFFLLAGELDKQGVLPDPEVMAWRLHTNPDDLAKDMDQLKDVGILGKNKSSWYVTNFAKRQSPLKKKEYMRRSRTESIREKYYGENYQRPETTETKSETTSDKKKSKTQEELSSAEVAFEKIKTLWEIENTTISRNVLDRLTRCDIADDGNGKILLIPDTKDNGLWIKERALTKLSKQINGLDEFNSIEIIL